MITKFDAIMSLMPDANITEDGDVVTWHDETQIKPSDYDIETELQRLIAEEEAKQYQYKRELEYPDFKEYLDGIVKGDQAQIDKYIADCQAVKAKYPKPTE